MNSAFGPPVVLDRQKSPGLPPTPSMTSHGHQDAQPVHLDAHDDARTLIRLVQCSECSRPLRTPVTLPCGNTVCRDCLPRPQPRANITFPALAHRQYGLPCPFAQCSQLHATNDCNVNVALVKIMEILNAQAELERLRSPAVPIAMRSSKPHASWSAVESAASETTREPQRFTAPGGRLAATLAFAKSGLLDFAADVDYEPIESLEVEKMHDTAFFAQMREDCVAEMECHVCYSLLLDPTTTPCGHTFCRKCLARILDHSSLCPECRRTLFVPSSLSRQPSNKYLVNLLDALCPEQVKARAELAAAEEQSAPGGLDTAVFPCTLAFPGLPTYLYIFEPRYRLMIRRAIEGNGRFGMVGYNRRLEDQGQLGRVHFMEVGTLLQIERYQMLPDGRSFIECRGLHRFKVLEHGILDGYIAAKIERVEDISLAEEEQLEVEETSQTPATADDPMEQIAHKSTAQLQDDVWAFVARARARSARWFSSRLVETYGDPPNDAARLPYWLAAVLPIVEEEKQKVLLLTSTRDRLKLAATWAYNIESQRWSALEQMLDEESDDDNVDDDDDENNDNEEEQR